jgi:hypothetical protein
MPRICTLALLISLVASACSPGLQKTIEATSYQISPDQPQICFLVCKITRKDPEQGPSSLALMQKNIASAVLKSKAMEPVTHANILVEQYQNKTLVETHTLSHPLFRYVEAFHAEENHFHGQPLNLSEADLALRVQLQNGKNRLVFYELFPGKDKVKIGVLDL